MQVMEAPVRVLKGLAAGAGKIIGVADRRKAKASKAAAAEPAAAEAVAPQAAPAAPETSGNVKVVTPEPAAPEAEAAPEAVVTESAAAEAAAPAAEAPAAAEVPAAAKEPAPAKPAKAAAKKAPAKKDDQPAKAPAGAAASELPLANYDELTVNSLRARMTRLSPDQLTVLIDYEKAHQGREDVIGMLERRVIRINSGQTTSFQAVK